mmetsp:Transcript_9251/g.15024  ORF Transcript_9251/g.15024 Transcript_9251/m.15024 type:complete len:378 (+) Transcript_9251:1245-2378(+)
MMCRDDSDCPGNLLCAGILAPGNISSCICNVRFGWTGEGCTTVGPASIFLIICSSVLFVGFFLVLALSLYHLVTAHRIFGSQLFCDKTLSIQLYVLPISALMGVAFEATQLFMVLSPGSQVFLTRSPEGPFKSFAPGLMVLFQVECISLFALVVLGAFHIIILWTEALFEARIMFTAARRFRILTIVVEILYIFGQIIGASLGYADVYMILYSVCLFVGLVLVVYVKVGIINVLERTVKVESKDAVSNVSVDNFGLSLAIVKEKVSHTLNTVQCVRRCSNKMAAVFVFAWVCTVTYFFSCSPLVHPRNHGPPGQINRLHILDKLTILWILLLQGVMVRFSHWNYRKMVKRYRDNCRAAVQRFDSEFSASDDPTILEL